MDGWRGAALARRGVLKGSAALAVAAGGLRGAPGLAQGLDWRRHQGTTLEVNLVKSPRGDLLQRHEREFTELTGIEVRSEATPEQQQRQKAVIELSSGSPSFDVVHLSYHVQKRQFERAGWLHDLSGFMADPALTAADLNEADFSQAGLVYSRDQEGRMRSLPWSVDYWIVYWNRELFARKGLEYPRTFDAMVAAAEALTDPAAGTSGIVARGLKNANVPVWSSFLLGHGGRFLDPAGQLATDSPEAIEAARTYQRLLSRSAPQGVSGFNWSECQAAFLQGRAAMWLDGVGFAPPLEDPDRSRVVGKVGYGVMPAGPRARASATFGDGIGVTRASRKKEAAYLYCQWAVSKEMGARLLQAGGGVPFRHSVLNDAGVRAGVKMPAIWTEAVAASAAISQLGLPVIQPVTEFRDTIGIALTNLLSGGDPAAEMRRATEQFRPVLERSERA